VETTIDLDALDNHEYIIKHEFDENLKVIKRKLDNTRSQMHSEHRSVGRDLQLDTEKKLFLENHRVHGWCFRLTRTVRHPKLEIISF
jgi:DNA mismatch repair protein MSH2